MSLESGSPQPSQVPTIVGAGTAAAALAFLLVQIASGSSAAIYGVPVIAALAAAAGAAAPGWFARKRPVPRRPLDPADTLAPASAGTVAGQPPQTRREPEFGLTGFVTAALDASPVPVIVIDSAFRLVVANEAARLRFSLSKMGTRIDTQIRRPELIEAIQQSLADSVARTLSFEVLIPVDRYETATVAPFAAQGRTFVLLTMTDQTEAWRAQRMRADFLANASHELRTPLASITGCIETLQGPARDDPASHARFFTIMHDQALRMGRLIADLLSLSRIEVNEHVKPTARIDLALAVRAAIEAVLSDPGRAERKVTLDHDSSQITINGDSDQVQQLVTNLLDNALKYGAAGPVVVRLQSGLDRAEAVVAAGRGWEGANRLPLTSPENEPGRKYAVIRVEDEGPGIDASELPRLAERFYRVEATAYKVAGTGLGLAIVKHILNRHRGGLMVESVLGRGTAFGAYLPQS